jgi:hypothetical protein
MEPAEVLELNNKEALLAEQQEQQELAVMAALSQLLVQRGAALQVRCMLRAAYCSAVGCMVAAGAAARAAGAGSDGSS